MIANSRPEILMGKLLSNTLSMEELQELLAGLGQEEMDPEYSSILERHFHRIMNKNSGQTKEEKEQ